jgi:hypothetical protein
MSLPVIDLHHMGYPLGPLSAPQPFWLAVDYPDQYHRDPDCSLLDKHRVWVDVDLTTTGMGAFCSFCTHTDNQVQDRDARAYQRTLSRYVEELGDIHTALYHVRTRRGPAQTFAALDVLARLRPVTTRLAGHKLDPTPLDQTAVAHLEAKITQIADLVDTVLARTTVTERRRQQVLDLIGGPDGTDHPPVDTTDLPHIAVPHDRDGWAPQETYGIAHGVRPVLQEAWATWRAEFARTGNHELSRKYAQANAATLSARPDGLSQLPTTCTVTVETPGEISPYELLAQAWREGVNENIGALTDAWHALYQQAAQELSQEPPVVVLAHAPAADHPVTEGLRRLEGLVPGPGPDPAGLLVADGVLAAWLTRPVTHRRGEVPPPQFTVLEQAAPADTPQVLATATGLAATMPAPAGPDEAVDTYREALHVARNIHT